MPGWQRITTIANITIRRSRQGSVPHQERSDPPLVQCVGFKGYVEALFESKKEYGKAAGLAVKEGRTEDASMNLALKNACKILLNSLYGAFAMKPIGTTLMLLNGENDILDIIVELLIFFNRVNFVFLWAW